MLLADQTLGTRRLRKFGQMLSPVWLDESSMIISPAWKSPSLPSIDSYSHSFSSLQSSFNSFANTACFFDLPIEVTERIAEACLSFPHQEGLTTLNAFSLTAQRFTLPAQRAMLQHLHLSTAPRIDQLVQTLWSKPALALNTESLTLSVGAPDGQLAFAKFILESGQHAQQLALLPLLPKLRNLRKVVFRCSYDCPENLVSLFVRTAKHVKSFQLVSAFGFSKLVYMTSRASALILSNWTSLERVNMCMPCA